MAFVFGLQTLKLIDFTIIFQFKSLKPKNKGQKNFYECCDLTKKSISTAYILTYLFTFNSNSSFPCGNAKINGNYIVCSTKLQIQQSGAHPFWIFFQPMLEFELRRKNSNFFFKCLPHHCWNKTSQKHFFIFISSYTIFGYLFISRFPAIYELSFFFFEFFFQQGIALESDNRYFYFVPLIY